MHQQHKAIRSPLHVPVKSRLEWIDVAKGIAITLVVLGHVVWVLSLLELPTSDFWRRILQATGTMRMPGFFLMSGLFAHRFATGTLERFARRRVVGFVYLFAIWLVITATLEVGLKLWLGSAANAVARTNILANVLRLETPLWYLIALPGFHVLWWATRRMPAWLPLAATFIGFVLVDTGFLPLPGILGSTGFRGMIQYSFFFMVGARLSQPLRTTVSRMTPAISVAVVGVWLAVEVWLPTMPLRSLLAVPALFAISQLVVLTPLKSLAQRAGRRTLPLYLMNWLAVAVIGGVWLAVGVPSNSLTQFLVPAITLPLVVAMITGVWHLTRNAAFLWGPPPALEDCIIDALRGLDQLEPASSAEAVDTDRPDPLTGRKAPRPINVPLIHAHRSLNTITR